MKTLFQHLNEPEYMHVLLNSFPVYGLAIALIGLAFALFARNRPAIVIALALIFFSGLSAWPTYHYGEEAYDRVKSMSDDAGEKWLDEHMARAEKLIWMFYVLAGLAAAGILVPWKWPRTATPLAGATLALGALTLGIGGWIAYPGGHVRHKEFRFEPPPVTEMAEHHHGEEHQPGQEQKPENSPAGQSEHVGHEAMPHEGASEAPKSEEEQKQLEASRLQLEASRLQLEASKKQLEAAGGRNPSASPGASSPESPAPEHNEHHPPR
jgi:hypothetical protein